MLKERKKRPAQHSSAEKWERRDLGAKLLVEKREKKAGEILRLQDLSKVNEENTVMLKTTKSIAFIHISLEVKLEILLKGRGEFRI